MKEENGVNTNQNSLEETVEMPALAKEYVEGMLESDTNLQNTEVVSQEETVPVLELDVNSPAQEIQNLGSDSIEVFNNSEVTPVEVAPITSVDQTATEVIQPVEIAPINVELGEMPEGNPSMNVTPVEVAPITEMNDASNTEVQPESLVTETLLMEEQVPQTMNTNLNEPTVVLEENINAPVEMNNTMQETVSQEVIPSEQVTQQEVSSNDQVAPSESTIIQNNVIASETPNESGNNSTNQKKNSILIGIIVAIVIVLSLGVVYFVVF